MVVQAYIRPKATGREMLLVSRIVVFVFGMFTGVICIILNVVRLPPLPARAHCQALGFARCTCRVRG